jgi:hypothetical protein
MKNLRPILKALAYLSIIAGMASCSSVKEEAENYAVRIKSDKLSKYSINPHTHKIRNASTLRAKSLSIQFISKPDTCPATPNTKIATRGYLFFKSIESGADEQMEMIPLEDIESVASKTKIDTNRYGNINYFERYQNPFLPEALREVPVDSVFEAPCEVCPNCPDRNLSRWMFEIKPGIAAYKDANRKGDNVGKNDWIIDATAAYRFGESKRLALGLMFTSGFKTLNKIDSAEYKRVLFALYARYDLLRVSQRLVSNKKIKDTIPELADIIVHDTIRTKTYDGWSDSLIIKSYIKPSEIGKYRERIEESYKNIEVRPCVNPFVYGFIGASVDKFSIDLFKLNYNSDCKAKLSGGGMDLSIPISYGFGIGSDFPLCSGLDLSADLGFRSMSFGENRYIGAYVSPVNKKVNAVILRFGIHI